MALVCKDYSYHVLEDSLGFLFQPLELVIVDLADILYLWNFIRKLGTFSFKYRLEELLLRFGPGFTSL